MSSNDHQRGEKKGQFCAVAPNGGKCECGNDYRKNGEAPASWESLAVEFKSSKGNAAVRRFEAHHILSVAPVTAIVLAATEIDAIVRNTKWCINNPDNMISMPMLAHTVFWYKKAAKTTPPPFANIPQHDWSHGKYLTEIKEKLGALVSAVKDKAKDHETSPKNIESDMVDLTKHFRNELSAVRGARKGGTHKAFSDAVCDPFSMASDGQIETKPFPSGALSAKIVAWEKKILGTGT